MYSDKVTSILWLSIFYLIQKAALVCVSVLINVKVNLFIYLFSPGNVLSSDCQNKSMKPSPSLKVETKNREMSARSYNLFIRYLNGC